MGQILATAVMSRASLLLNDADYTHWTRDELLSWLNDGQREIALYRPSACVINTDVALVPGTKQKLPVGGNSLVDIPRNTAGGVIRPTSRQVLDSQVPDWHMASKASAKTIHYCYTPTDPKTFYVYPPSPGGNSVEVIYNANPPDATEAGAISVDDVYMSALIDYILFRALSKDTDFAPNAQTAASHYQAFLAVVRGDAPAAKA